MTATPMDSDRIDQLTSRIDRLPLLDLAVFEIIPLLNDPESNFEAIVRKLSPAVAAIFLKALNSAHPDKKIRSIKSAVRLLGYQKMKQVIVSSLLIDHLTKQLDYDNFSFDKFHRQAHFCGAVSQVLGKMIGFTDLEDLYTVALLQNIGKLIISIHFKESHQKIIALKKERGLSTREAEHQVLGMNHAELGAWVLEKFNIPPEICEAIRYHNAVETSIPTGEKYCLTHLARAASRIVAKFTLPETIDPQEIIHRLTATVTVGQKMLRESFQHGNWTGGFDEALPGLLASADVIVSKDLKSILNERIPVAAG